MKQTIIKRSFLAEVAGWYGTIAVLLAYGLLSFGVIESQTIAFQLLNLTGAIGIIIVATYKKVRQVVVLNIIWALLAVYALLRLVWIV